MHFYIRTGCGQGWPAVAERFLVFSAKGRWVAWREIERKGGCGSQAAELSFRKSRTVCTACAHMPNTTTSSQKTPLGEGLTSLEQSRCFSSPARELLGCEEMA